MVSRKQISKTSASRKVLTEGLQNNDRLDIADLLQLEKERIDDILIRLQEISVDTATANYIYNLVNISDMLLSDICTDFLNMEVY